VRLDPPPLGPGIGFVMVVDVGNEQAVRRFMDDQPQISANPHRPEIRIL
jgi:hypothetical protein